MEPRTNFVILKKYHLILECFSGDIDLIDIINLKNRVSADPDYNPAYHIIEDFRNSRIRQNKDKLEELVRWLAQNTGANRHSAILTHNPDQVAAAELFTSYSQKLPMHIRVFSTVSASLNWVKAPLEGREEIEAQIDAINS